MSKIQVVFDTECYVNYWLLMIKRVDNNSVAYAEIHNDEDKSQICLAELLRIMRSDKYEFISFNGNSYDMPMISYAAAGASNHDLKVLSDDLIVNGLKSWEAEKKYGYRPLEIDHIDLIEVAKGDCSLKLYAGRLHAQKMQDLPIDPSAVISDDDAADLREYCINDLNNTWLLAQNHVKQIDERRNLSIQYGMDLRSKSDAQIAEAVIKQEVESKIGSKVRRIKPNYNSFIYSPPEYISFSTDECKRALEILANNPFIIKDNGVVTKMPDALQELQIKIGDSVYQMGMGGLHSTESERTVIATDDMVCRDADVASYYPALMINNGMSPENMGDNFMDTFRGIRDRRVEAKRNGDSVVANLLKITLNGCFGKLGSIYSIFYAPKMMVQVTVTGQLSLLMLIERLELLGIKVISANTDGIVSLVTNDKLDLYSNHCKRWEAKTGLELEFADYSMLAQRDVNSYIAITTNGKVKRKGFFAPTSVEKNPQNEICLDAVVAYLRDKTPFEDTVRNCRDIRKFVTVVRVSEGAKYGDNYLGKVVRFYYSRNPTEKCITKSKSGNTVPRSTGSTPLMDLPDSFPTDVDYEWYIQEAKSFLWDLGVEPRPIPTKLPRRNTKAWKELFESGDIVQFEDEFCHKDDLWWKH